jgi:hypothetical protein
VDAHLLKLQRLQKRVLRGTSVSEMHVAFKVPYVYDYITKLCRTRAEVILNHENPKVFGIGQEEAMHRKYTRLKLGGGQGHDSLANRCFGVVK